MIVLPVLDLLEGQVVRGVAGRRADYRPLVSRLTSSSDPLDVARAIRKSYGVEQFYVADLDGIMTRRPNRTIYRRLIDDGFQLIVDAGLREPDEAIKLRDAGVIRVIVGLETCRSPEDLMRIGEVAADITFSLDLLNGIPRRMNGSRGWSDRPDEIIRQAVNARAGSILPLDLADVGMETGGSTDALCRFIHDEFPTIRVIAGGGVRGRNDLIRLKELGVDAVLVASAIHDGKLTREDVFDPRTG